MATSVLKTRIQHKYDTPANWAKATTFVPLKGELCIFNNGSGAKPEMKIGDGTTALASLPFLKAGGDVAVSRSLTSGTKIATITVDGVATDLYCETNTDTNTTYSAGTGITLSGTQFSLNVAGAKAALGLGSNAYSSTAYLPLSGGTITGALTVNGGSNFLNTLRVGSSTSNNYAEIDLHRMSVDGAHNGILCHYVDSNATYSGIAHVYDGSVVSELTFRNGYLYTNQPIRANLEGNATTATDADRVDGYHADRFFRIYDWWTNENGNNVNDLKNGSTFVYTTHGAPTNGTCASFSNGNTNYHLQIQGNYYGGQMYWRTHNGDNNTWNAWKQLWNVGDSITGAVWNDYAEYRESTTTEFGRVLIENGDDTLSPSTERLQPFAGISSDTWGFCQGETDRAKTPIAVAGRVLAYPYRNRNEYKPGDCLCAAPNGTVDIMTREEVERYPDRIVGTVSCVPQYEEWGQGDRPAVKVDGRIWVKVR